MGTEDAKDAASTFKSLRDYILWEINSGGPAAQSSVALDDDSESSSGLNRALRGKMRYLALARSPKAA